VSTLRDQLARFHGAITGLAPLDSARDLVERGEIDELERLHVYEHAYTARIASVLVHDYPKLARLVGESELRSWTAEYVRAYPPSSFSLREVGAHLAQWILDRESALGHRGDADRESALGHRGDADRESALGHRHDALVLAELARLERARTEVFDGPDATPLSREDLATIDPAEFPSLVMRLVPSSRVVTLSTTADDVWDALENEGGRLQTSTRSEGDNRVVLVWRRDLVVIHRTLDLDEARIVPTMIAGTTFGAACDLLDEATAAERAIELLVRWLDAQILLRA
jgi:hypothetical protein